MSFYYLIFIFYRYSAIDFLSFNNISKRRPIPYHLTSIKGGLSLIKNFFIFIFPSIKFSLLEFCFAFAQCHATRHFFEVFQVACQEIAVEFSENVTCFRFKLIEVKIRVILLHAQDGLGAI